MREHPLFIPYGDERLATLLTVPDGDARGLAVLLTGIGAPRSHRFQMWTRLARRLAERDVASIRLDYHGMGDSTGTSLEWMDDWNQILLPEVQAVARAGMELVGVDRVAAMGNCGGAELSLGLAATMPESVGALCLLLSVLEQNTLTTLHRRARMSRLAKAVRRSRRLARVVARPLRGRRPERRAQSEILRQLRESLTHGRILCLYGEKDREYTPRVQAALQEMAGSLKGGAADRFALQVVPGLEIGGFESAAVQDLVIDTAFEWMSSVFGSGSERAVALEQTSEVGA